MSADAEQLATLIETWHGACGDFVAFARTLDDEQAALPTDLAGWSVKDNLAHTAHLEAVLAGAPEETIEVAEAPHLRGLMNYYTEQGVLARRDRSLGEIIDELETSVAKRYAELQADPPVDGSAPAPRTPGGVPWSNQTLLANRPLDVWMHQQDIRRAIDQPGGYDTPAAAHVIDKLGKGLAMVVGKRVAPPVGTTVQVEVPDAGFSWTVQIGDDGRAGFVESVSEPTTCVSLTPEDFVVLAGGRRTPEATNPKISGDAELAGRVLESLAVTP